MKLIVKVSFISYNEVVQVVKLKIKKRREHISCNSKFVIKNIIRKGNLLNIFRRMYTMTTIRTATSINMMPRTMPMIVRIYMSSDLL